METDAIEKADVHTSGVVFTPHIPVPALPGGFSKRKLKKVRNQLGFYFSSSNILKDRYLQQHMSPPMDQQQQSDLGRGYVELDLIAKFGVIKELTSGNMEAVRRGVELSPHLELSEDKRRVRRKEPIVPLSEEEISLRTIYIEHIPPKINSQQALQKMFSKYGTVTYVSLPHYRPKKKASRCKQVSISKGFAFIEFSSPYAVTRAVSAFQSNQTEIQVEFSETKIATPNDILTINHSPPLNFGKDLTNKSGKAEQNRKRRYDVEEGDETVTCQKVKRNKFDSVNSFPVNSSEEGERYSVTEDVTAVKKKKVRNRLRRKKRLREKNVSLPNRRKPSEKCVLPHPMRVLTKLQWLSLKSEFKSKQKECLGQLKQVNKQARLDANFTPRPREEKMDCEVKEVPEKKRGCDKILNQCMQIAESRFKY